MVTRKIQLYINDKDKDIKNEKYKRIRDFSYFSYKLANELMTMLWINLKLKVII
jgi:hypothetical protein